MLRIAFIGCVEFSETALKVLVKLPNIEVVGVLTRAQSNFNADFRNLEPIAQAIGCPICFSGGDDQELISSFLSELEPDLIYCFGWSFLLGEEILSIPKLGVIGYHPTGLPQNRGRHPIIWTLALGLEETASTFFLMDAGADSGDIVSQKAVSVCQEDNARTLYNKLTKAASQQIQEMTQQFVDGTMVYNPQNSENANIWRKRGMADGRIDWRMPADGIYNLVRALTKPYVGAHIETPEGIFCVWEVEIGPEYSKNIEPGKVLEVIEGRIVVKCGDLSIIIIDHEVCFKLIPGTYL